MQPSRCLRLCGNLPLTRRDSMGLPAETMERLAAEQDRRLRTNLAQEIRETLIRPVQETLARIRGGHRATSAADDRSEE